MVLVVGYLAPLFFVFEAWNWSEFLKMHRYEVSSVFMSQDLNIWEFLILGQKKSEFLANKAHN